MPAPSGAALRAKAPPFGYLAPLGSDVRTAEGWLPRRPPAGLLYHSDRGVQYACGDFRAGLAEARLVARMSRKGNCYDNAAMESFWSSFKRECADGLFSTRCDGAAAAFDHIETFYNRVRLPCALGYQSPVDFENQLN